jgi:hypothetical protein
MSRMRILTTRGVVDVEVSLPLARSAIGSHWNAVQHFLATGDTDQLQRFRLLPMLLTDPDEIERLARIGELDIDGIYDDSL